MDSDRSGCAEVGVGKGGIGRVFTRLCAEEESAGGGLPLTWCL